ncbi:glutathione S-transferase family protein [Methylococcus mesophilus]|uniref:glutathione S-transferase family protein n=1 Tax=Methylococcus mesophilus TaxID=2993564 RepID=UPI00224A643F|nr:glutathione binding-like protein [Methylococcus mesophilus]UZR29571.1 glutathione binding-like protein [Methylococcus mesophilus]
MPTLYVAPGACSFGAHVVLKELGIPHEIAVVPLRTPDSPIHRVNPLGRVPALKLDSGEVLTENGAILPFLGDLKPEAGLFGPAGSVERARIQEWIGFLNSELHPAFRPVNRPEIFHDDGAAHDAIKAKGAERLLQLLHFVDRKLEGKTWAIGDRFTIADAYLGVFWRWLHRTQSPWLAQLPNLAAFGARFDQRPSVQAALAAETAPPQQKAA